MSDSKNLLKRLRFCTVLVMLLMLLGMFPQFVYAQQSVGSIQLDCHVQKGNDTIPLSGDTYAIVPIAEIDVKEQGESLFLDYRIKEGFEAFDCDWAALTDGARLDKALKLEEYCKNNNLLTTKKVSDSNGILRFDDLSTGLYLIVRVEAAEENAEYSTPPFLVDIPTLLNGVPYYDLKSVPKFEGPDTSPPPPSPSPSTPPAEEDPGVNKPAILPQTGDNSAIGWWLLVLAISFGAIVGISIYKKRRRQ